MSTDALLDAIYKLRCVACLLLAAVLVIVGAGTASTAAAVAWLLLVYPHLLQALLRRVVKTAAMVRLSLLTDAPVAGGLAGMLHPEPAAAAMLLAIVLTGILIVGSWPLLCLALPLFVAGAVAVHRFSPGAHQPSDSLMPLLSLALVVYMGVLGLLVYRETRRLNLLHRHDLNLVQSMEALRQRLMPYVSPQLLLVQAGTGAVGVPQRKRLTIFFSDIAGFTRLMDLQDEARVAAFLNEYFSLVNEIAVSHGGTLDKFLGDGVMVFFGDPHTRGPAADAYACAAMALEMRDRIHRLVHQWQAHAGINRVRIRIGIHSGYGFVGSFGSPERRDYTAMGSAINIASRIEQAADPDDIVISGETCRLIRAWARTQDMGECRLKGVRKPVHLHSLRGLSTVADGQCPARRPRLLN